jgi:hypothetical protein
MPFEPKAAIHSSVKIIKAINFTISLEDVRRAIVEGLQVSD